MSWKVVAGGGGGAIGVHVAVTVAALAGITIVVVAEAALANITPGEGVVHPEKMYPSKVPARIVVVWPTGIRPDPLLGELLPLTVSWKDGLSQIAYSCKTVIPGGAAATSALGFIV